MVRKYNFYCPEDQKTNYCHNILTVRFSLITIDEGIPRISTLTCTHKGRSRHVSFAPSDHRIRIVDASHDRICGWVMIRDLDTARPMSHVVSVFVHYTEQIGGVHNLYDDRIGQMIHV